MEDTNAEGNTTIVSQLKLLAKENPSQAAFVFWDKDHKRAVLSRQDVWEKSTKFAAMLKRLGVKKGDIVCNTLINSQERLFTTYGTLLVGASSMHGQKLLADGEDIMKNWQQSQCRFIIVDPNEKNGPNIILERIKKRNEIDGTCVYDGLPFLSMVIPIVMGDRSDIWLNALNNETETFIEENISQDDVPFIFTTSGTTGFSKLVEHTYRSLFTSRTHMSYDSSISILNTRSLGWLGGFPVEYPMFGFKRVLLDLSHGPFANFHASIINIIEYEHIDIAGFCPSDIQLLLDELDTYRCKWLKSPIKHLATGGGPVSTSIMKSIGRLADKVSVHYASTEVMMVTQLSVTDPSTYKNACTGNMGEGVSVKILDEFMNQVPNGTLGEIYVLSKSRAKGYLNDMEATKEAFLEDGWFRTSDIGHLDENGQLFVYCRKSNCINHKGFIHYPGWMETRINKHPDIKDCLILGIPDPATHEELCLCVVKERSTDLSSEKVRNICKDMFLTNETDLITPIPKFYLFFDSFPLNSNGKIDRKSLRKLVMELLSLKSET